MHLPAAKEGSKEKRNRETTMQGGGGGSFLGEVVIKDGQGERKKISEGKGERNLLGGGRRKESYTL